MKRFLLAVFVPVFIVAIMNGPLIINLFKSNLYRPALAALEPSPSSSPTPITLPDNTLFIPALGLTAPIVPSLTNPIDVQDWNILKKDLTHGVSLAEKLAKPGESGISVIIGHSSDWTPHKYAAIFASLNNLQSNELIYVKYRNVLYKYQVDEQDIISPQQITFLDQKKLAKPDQNQLALITCWPVLTTAKRLVVISHLVQ